MNVEIPKGDYDSPAPCWIPVIADAEGKKFLKPQIKCNCGKVCCIGLHHVHADGTVTIHFYDSEASSFMHKGKTYSHTPGCGWRVFLKLKDYDCGDFPPSE